jgi:hypothetical protein
MSTKFLDGIAVPLDPHCRRPVLARLDVGRLDVDTERGQDPHECVELARLGALRGVDAQRPLAGRRVVEVVVVDVFLVRRRFVSKTRDPAGVRRGVRHACRRPKREAQIAACDEAEQRRFGHHERELADFARRQKCPWAAGARSDPRTPTLGEARPTRPSPRAPRKRRRKSMLRS